MTTASVGLQLYTVRDIFAQDPLATLARAARLGFAGVEFAGYGGLDSARLRRELDALGLAAPASHVSIERLTNAPDAELAYAAELGVGTVVAPYARFDDPDAWTRLAETLEDLAQRSALLGMQLAYHNHAHEIRERVGEVRVLDHLLERAPAIGAELDLAWIEAGGADPVDYLERYAGRVPLIHLKDYRPTEHDGDSTVELGTGVVDLDAALAAAERTGVPWIILEQDHCPGDAFASVEQNLAWYRDASHAAPG